MMTSVRKNYIYNLILTAANMLFPLLTYAYASRILMPEGIGKTSFAVSVVSYFTMFVQLGIPTYGVRICATCKEDKAKLSKTVQELLKINLIMAVVSAFALALCIMTIPRLYEIRLLIAIYAVGLFSSIAEMNWLFNALEEYAYITKRTILIRCMTVVAILLLIHKESDYMIYAGIMAGSSAATGLLNLHRAKRFVDFVPRLSGSIKHHLRPVLIFFLMSVATTVYLNLDTVMLGFMSTDTEVGFYNAATRMKTVLNSVVVALGVVMLPRMSKLATEKNKKSFWEYATKSINYTLLLSIPLAVYFVLYAREFILILSGECFLSAIPAMQFIIPSIVFIGMTNVLGIQILVPCGMEKQVLYSEIAGAVMDVALNLILIPKMGAAGAALGTLCAEGTVLIVQLYFLREHLRELFSLVSYKNLIFANVAASCGIMITRFEWSSSFAKVCISAFLFFGIYVLVLLYRKEVMILDGIHYGKDILTSCFGKKKDTGDLSCIKNRK